MTKKRANRVREQVMVYLTAEERALLERVAERTGLPRTEIFRRGLQKMADESLHSTPGQSLRHLIETATADDYPPDLAERHEDYLYGGKYGKPGPRKHARPD